jgi:MinD superfamily P-loop ATPase
MRKSIRLAPTQAEATCTLCGHCQRVTAKDALLAAQEATRRIVRHRQEKHYTSVPATREITGGTSSHSVQGERSPSGRGNTAGRSAIAVAGA